MRHSAAPTPQAGTETEPPGMEVGIGMESEQDGTTSENKCGGSGIGPAVSESENGAVPSVGGATSAEVKTGLTGSQEHVFKCGATEVCVSR